MSTLTARSAPRTIIGLLAALGLVAALTMPALASHETDLELVPPGAQSDECDGYDYGWKLDDMDKLSAGVYTASDADHTVWIKIQLFENGGNEVNAYTILEADPEIADIYVKQPVENGGISHLTFCYNVPEVEESQPEESQPEESQPEESQPEESQPEESEVAEESAPAESIREDTQGGNPTPSGGTLPNTAVGQFGQIPATLMSLVLLGALAATVYVRLARQR